MNILEHIASENPLWLFFGIAIGIVGSEGTWSIVRLVRQAVVNRKAKRIKKKRREEYGVMLDDALSNGGKIIITTAQRYIEIKSREDNRSKEVKHTAPHRTPCKPMDNPKETQGKRVEQDASGDNVHTPCEDVGT